MRSKRDGSIVVKRTGGLIHGELSFAVALLGHGDSIVVGDAGLPVAGRSTLIDLAVSPGTVSFRSVVAALSTEMCVESLVMASELAQTDQELVDWVAGQYPDASVEMVSHSDFKGRAGSAGVHVRTGEYTPYANVVLVAGVPF